MSEQWAHYADCKAAAGWHGLDIRLCAVHSAKSKAASTTAASASNSRNDNAAAVHNGSSSDTAGTAAGVSDAVTGHVSTTVSNSSSTRSTEQLYESQARVLLIGAGADEQVRAVTLSNVTVLALTLDEVCLSALRISTIAFIAECTSDTRLCARA
eukprot:10139-Heterococcus_DN1.PRE.2